jgi:hypothetical protein
VRQGKASLEEFLQHRAGQCRTARNPLPFRSSHIRLATRRIANIARQVSLAIRLVEQRNTGIKPAVVHDGVFRVARRVQHVQ